MPWMMIIIFTRKLMYCGYNKHCKLQRKQHKYRVAALGWYEKESRQLPGMFCPGLVNPSCQQPKTEGWRTTAASTAQSLGASGNTIRNCSNTYPQRVIKQASNVPAGKLTLRPTAGKLRFKQIKKLHIDWQNDLIGASFKNIRWHLLMAYIIFHLQPISSESKSSSDVFITGQNYILVKFFF